MRAQGDTDWPAVRDLYEHTNNTLDTIAQAHDLSTAQIKARARAGGWLRYAPTGARTGPDWVLIEAEYRAGLSTVKQIGAAHGVPAATIYGRVSREGWARDQHPMLGARLDTLLAEHKEQSADSADAAKRLTLQRAEIQSRVLEVAAQCQRDIILQHRDDITRLRGIAQDQARELIAQGQEGKLAGRVDALCKLATAVKTIIGLERQAFGLSDNANGDADTPPAPEMSQIEAARRIAFVLASGAMIDVGSST